MGSDINIGLAAPKSIIKKSVINLFEDLREFVFERVFFPNNNNYNEWISLSNRECSIEEAFDYCFKYEMSYFVGGFLLYDKQLNNVEFAIEKTDTDIVCFIIKIPDSEFINKIDEFESTVIEFLKNISGFNFAFCDSEAHLDDENYSIYVQYLDKPIFTYKDWKIDGLTKRSSIR